MKFITFNERKIRTVRKEIAVTRISLGVSEKNNQTLKSIIHILAHIQMATSKIRVKFGNFITLGKYSVVSYRTLFGKVIVSLPVNKLRLNFIV